MRETRRQQRAKITILFVILIALLAQLITMRVSHGAEQYITSDSGGAVSVAMRDEATIVGNEIRFKQITRWASQDNDALQPVGELIVARFGTEERFKSIGLSELRGLLTQAGVNLAPINFVGPTSCTITRSEMQLPEGKANQQLNTIEKNKNSDEKSQVIFQGPSTAPSQSAGAVDPANRTLRAILCDNLAQKLNLPVDTLQVDFKSDDDGKLRMTEAQCKLDIEPQRTGALGSVSWYVKMTSNGSTTRSFITANARAWQDQLVVARPLSIKQKITADDIAERRSLVDRLSDDPLLKKEQVVGQVASRDLKPGTLFTSRLVDSAPMVRAGDFVTIENAMGTVKVRIVARALDAGCYGQTIRVMNETTREISRVTVTGPQQASMGLSATES